MSWAGKIAIKYREDYRRLKSKQEAEYRRLSANFESFVHSPPNPAIQMSTAPRRPSTDTNPAPPRAQRRDRRFLSEISRAEWRQLLERVAGTTINWYS